MIYNLTGLSGAHVNTIAKGLGKLTIEEAGELHALLRLQCQQQEAEAAKAKAEDHDESPRPKGWGTVIDEMVAHVAANFACVDGIPTYRCQTGDQYVTLVIGGVKHEGANMPPGAPSRAEAAAAWIAAFDDYAAGKSGKVYWRTMPDVAPHDGAYQVYSRLVISDKPPCSSLNGNGAYVWSCD